MDGGRRSLEGARNVLMFIVLGVAYCTALVLVAYA